jgi:hypothetical protein
MVSLIPWPALWPPPLPQKNLLPNSRGTVDQSWSGCLEENKFLFPARIWTQDPRSSSLKPINYTVPLCHNMTALRCRMTIMVHQNCKCHYFLNFLRKHGRYSWFQTFAVFCMLYVFFWVIPRRLNFICRRFGTLYLFHLHLLAYEDGTDRVFQNIGI